MHIVLTTPWAAGSIGDMATYPHAKIVGFEIDIARNKHVVIVAEFGEMVDGEWQRGVTGRYRIRLGGSEYDAFLAANGATLQSLQTALYATVQEKYPSKAAGVVT